MWKKLRSFQLFDVLALGLFLSAFAFAAFFFLREQAYVQVTLRVSQSDELALNSRPPYWFLSQIKPGLAEKDVLGRVNAEVVDVYSYPSSGIERMAYITLNLRAVYNKRTGEYSYNGTPLLFGGFQSLRVQGYKLTGIVTSIGKPGEEVKRWYVVKGYLDPVANDPTALSANTIGNGIPLHLSNKFKNGLEMRDSRGELIAKVVQISKTPGVRRALVQGSMIEVPDLKTERVEVQSRLLATETDGAPIFQKDQSLVINGTYYLDFKLFGSVVIIQDVQPAPEN